MSKVIVVINEQHSLMGEQASILNDRYDIVYQEKIPTSGLKLDEAIELAGKLLEEMQYGDDVVFVTPLPITIARLYQAIGHQSGVYPNKSMGRAFVFHNDERNKKELPNGKVVYVVAKNGWVLA